MALFPRNARTGQSYKKFGRKYIYSETTEAWEPVVSLASVSEARATAAASVGSTTVYALASELPLSNNTAGELAFVQETDRLYIWSGTGWYNIATIELASGGISGADASYDFATDGTPIVITLTQTGLTSPTWSYEVTSGSINNTATITQVDNVFTITPTTNARYNNTFGITFTATDGSNTIVSDSEFTLYINTYSWQGSTYGYSFGGSSADNGPAGRNVGSTQIVKFAFASGTSNREVGELTQPYAYMGSIAASSMTHAYISGGYNNSLSPGYRDELIKRQFAGDVDFAAIGVSSVASYMSMHNSSEDNGYIVGGLFSPPARNWDRIDKFPFASDGDAVNVSNLVDGHKSSYSHNSSTHGYAVMGDPQASTSNSNKIQRFNFASDVAENLTRTFSTSARYSGGPASSTTDGYQAGGTGGANYTQLSSFPFASDTPTIANIGSISAVASHGGVSSTTDGYSVGGWTGPTAFVTRVQKYPFASGTPTVDTSFTALAVGAAENMGSQV